MANFIDLSDVKDFSVMPEKLKERLSTLTPRERKYFMSMWPKSGVPFLKSKPGIAKSAMVREIASKMGFNYIPLYLSMRDETDIGQYPYLNDGEYNGRKIKVLDFVVPKWALDANDKPTIIHFDELNRAQPQVRNAALQILLDRAIGTEFKFNETVLMIASGNLGDSDGTVVEEFDTALNNRLIHFSHSLGVDEWLDWAKDNCHWVVTSYIRAYPERLYQDPTEDSSAFATPRSWTFLSDFITRNYGRDAKIEEFLSMIQEIASNFIGPGAQKFVQYCYDMSVLNINDVLDSFDEVKETIESYGRDKRSELLFSLKEIDYFNLKKEQRKNVIGFLQQISSEERISYLIGILDNWSNHTAEKQSLTAMKELFENFREEMAHMTDNVERNARN
jgi:hypothetical protein